MVPVCVKRGITTIFDTRFSQLSYFPKQNTVKDGISAADDRFNSGACGTLGRSGACSALARDLWRFVDICLGKKFRVSGSRGYVEGRKRQKNQVKESTTIVCAITFQNPGTNVEPLENARTIVENGATSSS